MRGAVLRDFRLPSSFSVSSPSPHRPIRSWLVAGLTLLVLSIGAHPGAAATRLWNAAGANSLWSNPQNWSGNQAPQAGDDLVFPAGSSDLTPHNDFPAGTSFHDVRIADTYTITGNRIAITGEITMVWYISNDTATLACDLQVPASGLAIVAEYTETLIISGAVSGAGGVTIHTEGGGVVRFEGATPNTYAGATKVLGGGSNGLVLAKSPGVVSVPAGLLIGDNVTPGSVRLAASQQIQGNVTIEDDSRLDLHGWDETIGALAMRSAKVTTLQGVLTLGGSISVSMADATSTIEGRLSLGGQTRTFHTEGALGGVYLRVLGEIINGGGPAGIIKTGTKTLALAGPNTYTGLTTVNQGPVFAEHPQAFGSPSFGTVVQPNGYILLMSDIPNEPLTGVNTYPSTHMLQCLGSATRVWGGPIALSGENSIVLDATCTVRLTGVISGSGSFRTSSGLIELAAHNVYAGATTLASKVRLLGSEVLPDGSPVTIHDTLDLNGHVETVSSVVAGAPAAEIVASGGTLHVAAATDSTYAGRLTGAGTLTKSGGGVWTLTDVHTFSGGANISAGRMVVSGVLPAAITLNGGTIAGAGTVGTIAGTSGTIAPGNAAGAPGLLNSASVAMNPAMTLALVINGPASGAQHAQLRVAGDVVLNGAALAITAPAGGAAAIGTMPLTIIDNDGSDAIGGTFANLPEGAAFTAHGVQWRISYTGGTGNDVTLQAASASYYLSEGATGPFFSTDLLIANPNSAPVNAELRFLKEDGTTVTMMLAIAALSRTTVAVGDVAGLEASTFSTVITSPNGLPLLVERTMRWDASGYGAHTEKASSGPALTWYFAEGSAGYFHTYLLLSNPQDTANNVTVSYLRENQAAVTRVYQLLPHARRTIDTSADPELLNRSFGMTVAFQHPAMAERAMYFGDAPLFAGGHASAGVTAPATAWFLAEGATGPYFDTFILLANPGVQPVDASVTYLPNTGVPVVKTHTIGAGERLTLNIELEHESLANVAVATQVTATTPIVVERSQYWPYTADQWFESHNSAGVTELGLTWGLAEGRVGGAAHYQSYILLANPGVVEASVQIQFLRESAPPVVKSFVVPPTSRVNVAVGPGADVPELIDESFGAIITSTQPIAVERAIYADANGVTWAAGTNATASRLP